MARAWAMGMVAWLAVPGLAGAGEHPQGTPPETRIVRSPPRVTTERLAEFEFESDDPGAGFECSLNEERFFECESPLRLYSRIHLGQRYTLRVRARDERGVEDPQPASYTWQTLLALPWQPAIIHPAPGDSVKEHALRVVGITVPGDRVRVLLDHQPVAVTQANSGGQWMLTVPVEEGPHTLFAEVEDEAGEAITSTRPVHFTVDTALAREPEPRGCSGAGGSPALFLIGLIALAIRNPHRE